MSHDLHKFVMLAVIACILLIPKNVETTLCKLNARAHEEIKAKLKYFQLQNEDENVKVIRELI